jgi:Fur family transcriptional regulator, ferric uptake regulator
MAAKTKNEDIILALRKAGISRTSQRVAVLNTLFTASQPLSAVAIRQCLKAKISIDKVTVYRILSVFRERGLIREIASAGGTGYFEIMTPENTRHPHFSCRNCGTVSCMPPQSFMNMPDLIQAKDDYCIEHIEINVSGLCSCCRNETPSAPPKRHHRKER